MNDVYAFIVGIEKYDQSGWNVTGPCANAEAMARWCLEANVPPANIFLFVDVTSANDTGGATKGAKADDLEALGDKGVKVVRSATSNVIDTFFRTELAKDRPANSKLLVFWSGHGYVMNDGTRIFICRDYTEEKLHNRVFNASNFLRYLRRGAIAPAP